VFEVETPQELGIQGDRAASCCSTWNSRLGRCASCSTWNMKDPLVNEVESSPAMGSGLT
jgi:hypothetical protein